MKVAVPEAAGGSGTFRLHQQQSGFQSGSVQPERPGWLPVQVRGSVIYRCATFSSGFWCSSATWFQFPAKSWDVSWRDAERHVWRQRGWIHGQNHRVGQLLPPVQVPTDSYTLRKQLTCSPPSMWVSYGTPVSSHSLKTLKVVCMCVCVLEWVCEWSVCVCVSEQAQERK